MSSSIAECKTPSGCAHIPKKSYKGSAGYDLWAAEAKTLKPGSRILIRLDLAMATPKRCYGGLLDDLDWQNLEFLFAVE